MSISALAVPQTILTSLRRESGGPKCNNGKCLVKDDQSKTLVIKGDKTKIYSKILFINYF